MQNLLNDLQTLLEESLRVLAAPESDIARLHEWGTRRQLIFARLENADFDLPAGERDCLAGLINEIQSIDATMVARLEQNLGVLGQQIVSVAKIRQTMVSQSYSYTSVLLERRV